MTDLPSPASREWTALHVICAAFVAVTLLLGGAGWFVVTFGSPWLPPVAELGGFALLLATAAVLLLLAAPLAQRLLARDPGARLKSMPAVPFETFRQAIIMAFALREGAATLGLVVTLLTRDPRWVLGLAATAMLAMLLGWPTVAGWERLNRS